MGLYEILACPTCKMRVSLENNSLRCSQCGQVYPIVDGIPVMLPGGVIPHVTHEASLQIRDSYNPWVHRVILQSLLDNQIVLEIGSGNMALDDPCIIRMDVSITPYVDLVADAHALPFLPESIDYIFSLAVFEHLRNPFVAAKSIFDVLKDGGFIYHECNFVFAYHGYPHHYFNASMQGMEQIFNQFVPLRKGVATYQMPSFALEMVLQTYLRYSHADEFPHGKRFTKLLNRILNHDLTQYDIYFFSEEEALNVAAGTYFAGIKQISLNSSLIPGVIRKAWAVDKNLQNRFPNLNQISTIDNILVWAKQEGRKQNNEIEGYLNNLQPFNKRGSEAFWNREYIHSMPLLEARFGAVGVNPDEPLNVKIMNAENLTNSEAKQRIDEDLSILYDTLRETKYDGLLYLLKRVILFILTSIRNKLIFAFSRVFSSHN
jgi:uncharacterized protein YbaR (Trm112 family)/SAM-dependent methyltransferase